jgi:hypothetical protein
MNLDLSSLPTPDESQKIKVNHVFECTGCHLYWLGRELAKVGGQRSCKRCLKIVTDITFTVAAREYLSLLGLPVIEQK